jgi:hypothetical protein
VQETTPGIGFEIPGVVVLSKDETLPTFAKKRENP